jgi:hypothetical protein
MHLLDNIPINAVDTEFSRPTIGCYPKRDKPLAVGVDRRRHSEQVKACATTLVEPDNSRLGACEGSR